MAPKRRWSVAYDATGGGIHGISSGRSASTKPVEMLSVRFLLSSHRTPSRTCSSATPASLGKLPLRRAEYTGALTHLVALSQALHKELKEHGAGALPRRGPTKFHERQRLDLRKVPRMSADDDVTASLRGRHSR